MTTTPEHQQGSRGHAGLLDHQDRRDDAGRNRRRRGLDDPEPRLRRRHRASSSRSSSSASCAQIRAKRSIRCSTGPSIVATTTAGTTMADFADRSLGIGYAGGSLILFAPGARRRWRSGGWRAASVSVDTITSPRVEMFYWVTILFSQRSAPRWATAWPIRAASATRAARWSSAPRWLLVAALYFCHRHLAHAAVLGRLHPDPPARRHARRPADQAARRRRPAAQPHHVLGGDRGVHRRLHLVLPQRPGVHPGQQAA